MKSITTRKLGSNTLSNASNLRFKSNMSIAEFSKASGICPSTIYAMEKRRKNKSLYQPTLRTVSKLAKLVGVSIEDFTESSLRFY